MHKLYKYLNLKVGFIKIVGHKPFSKPGLKQAWQWGNPIFGDNYFATFRVNKDIRDKKCISSGLFCEKSGVFSKQITSRDIYDTYIHITYNQTSLKCFKQ